MKKNQDYKNEALAALKGNWAQAVVATVCGLRGAILGGKYGPYGTASA